LLLKLLSKIRLKTEPESLFIYGYRLPALPVGILALIFSTLFYIYVHDMNNPLAISAPPLLIPSVILTLIFSLISQVNLILALENAYQNLNLNFKTPFKTS